MKLSQYSSLQWPDAAETDGSHVKMEMTIAQDP